MPAFRPSREFLAWFLIGILLVHGWALITSAYFYFWWLDLLLHLAGGFWVGVLGVSIFNRTHLSNFFFWLSVLGFAALVGIFWEFLEFGLNQVWESLGRAAFFQPGLEDTLSDLLADLAGGVASVILFRKQE